MEKRKLIVISIDSMVTEDLEIIRQMPHMGKLLERSSIIRRNLTTYPSYTHSIHTSISTGCYPGTHGVIGNEHFDPGNMEPEWFEKATDVKVPTLIQEARKHGYTAAEVYWPLPLGDDAEWNIHRAGIHVIPENEQEIIRQRSKPGFFDEVYPYIKDSFKLHKYYKGDELCFDTAEYLIGKYQPDVMYLHLVCIDYLRHNYGVFSKELWTGYEYLDKGFARILKALKEQGLENRTIINVTSDHGHLDIRRVYSINRFLRDHGFITVDENGGLADWTAYFHTCSLSGHLYIKNHDPEVAGKVISLLKEHAGELNIEKFYTREEVKEKYHLDGDFDYVLESFGNASFSSDFNAELVQDTNNASYRSSIATHGHEPYKGVQPTYFLYTPYSRRKVDLPQGRIIDQAPTLARLLGFEMTTCDGSPIKELLEEGE